MNRFLKIGEAAKILGVFIQTMRPGKLQVILSRIESQRVGLDITTQINFLEKRILKPI